MLTKVKLNESVKLDMSVYFACELRELWNMKVTVVIFVAGALGIMSWNMKKTLGLELKKYQLHR